MTPHEDTDFRALIDSLADCVLVFDPRGHILFANPAALQQFRYDPGQLVGQPVTALQPPAPHDRAGTSLAELIDGQTPLGIVQVLAGDRTVRSLEMRVSHAVWQGQTVRVAVGRDLHYRRQNEHLLLIQRDLAIALSTETQLERALQRVLQTALDATDMDAGSIHLMDPTENELRLACHLHVNDDAILQHIARYNAASPYFRFVQQGVPLYAEDVSIFYRLEETQMRVTFQALAVVPIQHNAQSIGCLNIASLRRTTVDPGARHMLETLASQAGSVIARLHAEEALRDSEEIARALLDNPAEAALLLDQEGTILGINAIGALYFDKTPSEMLGVRIFSLFPPSVAVLRRAKIETVFATGQPQRFEDEWLGIIFDNTLSPLFDATGAVSRVAVYARDITDFRRSQTALNQQRVLLAGIAEATGVLLATPDFREAIAQVLALLGQAAQTDHVYICQNRPDPKTGTPSIHYLLHWTNEAIDLPIHPALETAPDHSIQWSGEMAQRWYAELSRGHTVSGLTRDFPAEEREFLEANGSLSLAVVPIFTKGTFWGFLGFVDHHSPREWTHDEITAIYTLASSVGSAIERHAAEKKLRHEQEISETLRDIGIALTTTLDLSHIFDRLLVEIGRVVPYDAANVMLIHNGVTSIVSSAGYDKHGLTPQQLSSIHFRVKDTPHLRLMAATHEPYVCPNALNDPEWQDVPGTDWIQSWLGGPIVARGETVGFFSLDAATQGFYNQEHVRLIASITRLTAIAYENAQLFEDIRALESEKSDIIHIASHDLRSPVMRIQASLDRLERAAAALPPEQRGELTRMSAATHDIQRILDEILSTERIEARHQAAEPIVWDELIERVAHSLQAAREEKHQTLDIACQPDLPVTRGDSARLEHAVLNLLDNAIKYTPPDGQIVVRVFLKEYLGALKIAVEVQDNGIGIPTELQTKLFEPFYRARQPGTEDTPGTGMGLSVVKAAVEYHRGRVYVDSAPGKGSLFGFWVPV